MRTERTAVILASLLLLAAKALAADKALPLSEQAGALLAGKSVVVTRHAVPSLYAMTAGKAAFAMLGAVAAGAAGNSIVSENGVADPADIIERELIGVVIHHYGMQPSGAPSPVVKVSGIKELLALKLDADYLIDVESGGWNFNYYAAQWGKYWVGYSVQVRLIDNRAGTLVSNLACQANTFKHEPYPTRSALLDNRAQLLKDLTGALGWSCVRVLAKAQFHLPEGEVPAIPDEFVDPAAAYLTAHPGAYDAKEEDRKH